MPLDPQVHYVAQRMKQFYSRLATLSQQATPPGTNAANGWFREWVTTDAELRRLIDPPTIALSGDAKALYEVYTFHWDVIHRAFRDNANHHAAWQGQIIWPGVQQMVGEIVAFVGSIFDLIGGAEKDKAKQNFAESLTALINKIRDSGYIWSGAHANGWISVYARDAGNWTLQHLDPVFPANTASDAGRVAQVMREASIAIARLRTDDHRPWLRAEWQVRFQAICEASTLALANIGQPGRLFSEPEDLAALYKSQPD